MGNSLGGSRKTTKVMKIDGSTIKLKTPVYAGEVVKDHPGHVLLESEAVKHYGIRAKPLEPQQELKPKRLYFLVELPEFPVEKNARRVRSGINMSAKDRLESLMLARRSASDLSILKPQASMTVVEVEGGDREEGSARRLKMRLPRAEVERLMKECRDEAEVAERMMRFSRAAPVANHRIGTVAEEPEGPSVSRSQKGVLVHKEGRWNGADGSLRSRPKRVGFLPIHEGEIQVAVAS